MNTETKEKTKEDIKPKVTNDEDAILIVFNDDFNTFDFVIQSFMEICKLTYEFSSKLAWTIHTKGSAVVKTGEYEELKKMKDLLVDRGIFAVVQKADSN